MKIYLYKKYTNYKIKSILFIYEYIIYKYIQTIKSIYKL